LGWHLGSFHLPHQLLKTLLKVWVDVGGHGRGQDLRPKDAAAPSMLRLYGDRLLPVDGGGVEPMAGNVGRLNSQHRSTMMRT
jgi:hypothetical protein